MNILKLMSQLISASAKSQPEKSNAIKTSSIKTSSTKSIWQALQRPNFKYTDFLHSDKANELGIINLPPEELFENGMKLADKMQELRDMIKLPIIISSGYRCKQVNTAVGGSKTSWHMKLLACDFNIKGLQPHEGVNLIKRCGFKTDKIYVERGCIHAQFYLDDKKNRNFFGTAIKVNGEWQITNEIKKV